MTKEIQDQFFIFFIYFFFYLSLKSDALAYIGLHAAYSLFILGKKKRFMVMHF